MDKKKKNKAQNQIVCVEQTSVTVKKKNNQSKAVVALSDEEKSSRINKIQSELIELYKKLAEIKGKPRDTPLNNEERSMVERWEEHKKKNESLFCFHASFKHKTNNGSEDDKFNLAQASLFEATGTSDLGIGLMILGKTAQASCMGKENEDSKKFENLYNSITNLMNSLKPQDEIEGMLISRLAALHFQSIHYLGYAASNTSTPEGRDININRSTKLSRLYNETLETLMRYRRKGEQKVVVQHVNVNDGGRAIVGNVLNGGGGNNQKNDEVIP